MSAMGIAKYFKQLAGESMVYGLSGVTIRLIGIFLIPVYTRIFKPSDYGVISLIEVAVVFVTMITILGLDTSAPRWYYDSSDPQSQRATIAAFFWTYLTASLLTAGILVVCASLVSMFLFGTAAYGHLLQLACCSLPLQVASSVMIRLFRFQRRPVATVLFSLGISLSHIGLTILFVVVWEKGLVGIYLSRIVTNLLSTIIAVGILGTWIAPRRFSSSLVFDMLRYGLPMVPAYFGLWVITSIGQYSLNIFSDTGEVGLYAIALSIGSAVALVTGAFQQAWIPFAFSLLNEKDSKIVYSRVLDLYSFLGCVLCTALALCAPYILWLLTTPAYYGAAKTVPFLAFACLLQCMSHIAGLGAAIDKKPIPYAKSIAIGLVTSIVFTFGLVPFFGRNGAATAIMATHACIAVYLFAASQKCYYIPYRFRPALICFGVSWLLIGIDRFLLPNSGVLVFAMRIFMCLLFIPVAFLTGIVRPYHLKGFLHRGRERDKDNTAWRTE